MCLCYLRNTDETKRFARYLLAGISIYLVWPLNRMTVRVPQSIIVQSASSFCSQTRFVGMQVLQYLRYINTPGNLTPLPCRVVNHCLAVQFLNRTLGYWSKPSPVKHVTVAASRAVDVWNSQHISTSHCRETQFAPVLTCYCRCDTSICSPSESR